MKKARRRRDNPVPGGSKEKMQKDLSDKSTCMAAGTQKDTPAVDDENEPYIPPQTQVMMKYKLCVLYMLDQLDKPASVSQLCDVLLEKIFGNFFHLQQAVAEMERDGFLLTEKAEKTLTYQITEDGRDTLSSLLSELSLDLRRTIVKRMEELRLPSHKPYRTVTRYDDSVTTGKRVHCVLLEGSMTVMDLKFEVPSEEAAKAICDSWALRWQNVYDILMEELLR